MMTKVLSSAVVVVLILLGGLYFLYSQGREENGILSAKNEALKFIVTQDKQRREEDAVLATTIGLLRKDFKKVSDSTRNDVTKLNKMLNGERFQRLLNIKPDTIVKKMNKKSIKVFDELAEVGK